MYAENRAGGGTRATGVGLSIPDIAKETAPDKSQTSGVARGAAAGTFLFVSGRQLLGWKCFHYTGNVQRIQTGQLG